MSKENNTNNAENNTQAVPQSNVAKKSKRLKRGGLSIILTVVVIIAAVLLNIVVTAVNNRYPFSIDLTSNKDYTIELDDEYKDYIGNLSNDIVITVCAAESDFDESGNYSYNMVSTLSLIDSYYGSVRTLTNKYARQTVLFLKTFPTMNSHINVQFKDANSVTDFASVKSQYSDESLSYGDIIVSCNHTSESGETYERYQILKIADIFSTEQSQSASSGYSYYYEISGSTLATQLTSALYVVTSGESVNVAVLGGHGSQTVANAASASSSSSSASANNISGLKALLTKNNYTLKDVDSLLTDAIPEDTNFAVLFMPTTDYTADEVKILSDWMKNNGKYGHNLVYVPSSSQTQMPVLEEFLSEWGIQILPANAYDETKGAYYYYPYYLLATVNDTDYTADYNSSENQLYPSPYRLAKKLFDENGNKKLTEVVVSPDTTVGMPLEADSNWTSANAEYKGPFDLVTICSDYDYVDSVKTAESNLLFISGDYFLQSDILTSAAYNSKLVMNLFNGLSGIESTESVTITDKKISTSSFSDVLINSYAPAFVYIIFVGLIPLALIAAGIVIWRVRKKH